MCVRMQVVYWNLCSPRKSYVGMCVHNVKSISEYVNVMLMICVRHIVCVLECVYVIQVLC